MQFYRMGFNIDHGFSLNGLLFAKSLLETITPKSFSIQKIPVTVFTTRSQNFSSQDNKIDETSATKFQPPALIRESYKTSCL